MIILVQSSPMITPRPADQQRGVPLHSYMALHVTVSPKAAARRAVRRGRVGLIGAVPSSTALRVGQAGRAPPRRSQAGELVGVSHIRQRSGTRSCLGVVMSACAPFGHRRAPLLPRARAVGVLPRRRRTHGVRGRSVGWRAPTAERPTPAGTTSGAPCESARSKPLERRGARRAIPTILPR